MLKLRLFVTAAALLSLAAILGASAVQAASPAINVAKNAKLGDILTDDRGMTLYVFKNDSPGKSPCTGGCAHTWPPFTVSDETNLPTLASGVTGKVAAISTTGGPVQVTFNDMPLYFYAQDAKPGDTNGQGIGGVWSVLSASGAPAASAAPKSSSSSKGKSYSKGNSYGKSSQYGMGSYGNYGMGGYGSYGMGGCGCYGYNYGPMMGYYRPYIPYFRLYRPFPRFYPFRFYPMMGMMRRY